MKCSSIVENRNGCEIEFLRNYHEHEEEKVFFRLPKNKPHFDTFSDQNFKIFKELKLFEMEFVFPEDEGVKKIINYENSSVIKFIQYFRQ